MDNIIVLDAINELGQDISSIRSDISALDNRITNNINNTSTFDHVWMITNSNSNLITSYKHNRAGNYQTYTFKVNFDGYYNFLYVPTNYNYYRQDYTGELAKDILIQKRIGVYGINSSTEYKYATINLVDKNTYTNNIQFNSGFLTRDTEIYLKMYCAKSSSGSDIDAGTMYIYGNLQYVNIHTVPLIY